MTDGKQQTNILGQDNSSHGIYERFDPGLVHSMALHHFHRYFCARELCRGKQVLDIACGTGYGTALIAETAARVVGVDIDHETIEGCRAAHSGSNILYREGRVEQIPAEDAEFEVVVSFETIEHVNEAAQKKFFQEIQRVLKPDGLLIMSSPIRNDATKNQFHIHELTAEEFLEALNTNFRHVRSFKQKIVLGSLIQQSASDSAVLYGIVAKEGEPIRPGAPEIESKYMIALASNQELPAVEASVTIDVTGKIFDAAIRTFVLRSVKPVQTQLTEQRRIATRLREAQTALTKEFAAYRSGTEAELAERTRLLDQERTASGVLAEEFAAYRSGAEAERVEQVRLLDQERAASGALAEEFAAYRSGAEAERAEHVRLLDQERAASGALAEEFAAYRSGAEADLAERTRLLDQERAASGALAEEFAAYRSGAEKELAERTRLLERQREELQQKDRQMEEERSLNRNLRLRNQQLQENVRDILSQPVWPMVSQAVKECCRGILFRPVRSVQLIRDLLLIASSGYFSQEYYLETNPDVASSGSSSLFHFCDCGWREGRAPSIRFDVKYYLDNNPDVRLSGRNPLVHYILWGRKEGRGALPMDTEEV